MNWLERARREIQECARRPTANSAERTLTAVMAVPHLGESGISRGSIGSNGSAPAAGFREIEGDTLRGARCPAVTQGRGG